MKLDVRCKFLLLIFISIVAFSAKDIVYGSFVFSITCILCFLLGQRKKLLKYVAVYIALVLFILLSEFVPVFLRNMILMIVLCMRMCMPGILYGQVFVNTTAVSEMVTGLYSMHIPKAFVITFAVAMRFLPTAKEEIDQIQEAMTLRGLGLSVYNLRKRPVLVFEGFITPLLVRASTVAEELSAASITRGLDSPVPRTAFTKLHITWRDITFTLIFTLLYLGVFVLREVVI